MSVMWYDGTLHDGDDIAVLPFTHALHYGSGVFEGIRAYETRHGTAIFRAQDHLERFHRSAEAYGLKIAYSTQELEHAMFATLEANAFTQGYIRPLAFFGEKGISLAPRYHCPTHVLVALKPLSGSLMGPSVRVCISPWQKTPSRSMPATVKASGHYMNSILALHDAIERGFDEAILLNDRGEVAEGTGENIFVVRNGRVRTNDASADVLDGITRATVIELARDRGIEVEVGPIAVRELLEADEVFLTGTAAEVTAVSQIDHRRLSDARPLTDELASAYAAAVRGEDPLHEQWLSLSGTLLST
ncbi:MAG TPA: branched-chain amino acid transaminase [Candidatus Dormibacteraeota bacterium]|nr:branched-chain amino acid transaminase [Candidatus Dormibacteraeota bacterium]